jgi:hypothetical protein
MRGALQTENLPLYGLRIDQGAAHNSGCLVDDA